MFEPCQLWHINGINVPILPTMEEAQVAGDCWVEPFVSWEKATRARYAAFWERKSNLHIDFLLPDSCFLVVSCHGNVIQVVGERAGWISVRVTKTWAKSHLTKLTSDV